MSFTKQEELGISKSWESSKTNSYTASSSETVCFNCESKSLVFSLKIIPTSKPFPFPKFAPQFTVHCGGCNRWLKFSPQTNELITKINQKLEVLKWELN